jgi:tetratricopeptide (TPR) repeat protein
MPRFPLVGARFKPALLVILLVPVATPQERDHSADKPRFLSGQVALEDGSSPQHSVTIERDCAGFTQPEAVTDEKSRFRVNLERYKRLVSDGSDEPPCDLRAVLTGFRPEIIRMFGTMRRDELDVGTIVLHSSGSTPPTHAHNAEAEETLVFARQSLTHNKMADAKRQLEQVVALDPNHAIGWYELGRVYYSENNRTDARRCYERAIAADPGLDSAYRLLANLLALEEQWTDLADVAGKLIRLSPADFPEAYFYSAVANYNLGEYDAAESAARLGLQVDARHRTPRLHYMLGEILADDRQFGAAANQMKLYLQYAPGAKDQEEARKLISEWQTLAEARD